MFDRAYANTMGHEGGYSNDPDDVGGETYKGISRVYNPTWPGWDIIDSTHRDTYYDNAELDRLVKLLYKQKYWEPFRGDYMPEAIAVEMFDTAVNMGVHRAVKFLQTTLNLLNRNQKLYYDIVEDGDYGNATHRALSKYLSSRGSDVNLVVKMLNVLQGAHYINYMKKSPTQEKYARGWFKRVTINKS